MIRDRYLKVKRQLKKAAKGKLSDHRIAISFAVGTFVAILPISVLAIGVCILLAVTVRYLSKVSLFLPLVFWNPIWHLIFAYPAKVIGKFLLKDHIFAIVNFFGVIPHSQQVVTLGIYYAVGMTVIAAYMAILSYFVVRLIVRMYRIRQIRAAQLKAQQ